jgi:hypothetical protein
MATNGIKTSFWGAHAWNFLFSTIAGAYPIQYNKNNKDHQKRVRAFIQLFNSLKETLPCIYCRQSYAVFIKNIPMKDYNHSRASMMKWLYLIHDQVNRKLISQERECFESEKTILRSQLQKQIITPNKYKQSIDKLNTILITKPSPKLETIIAKYEKQRAGCNPKNKTCS